MKCVVAVVCLCLAVRTAIAVFPLPKNIVQLRLIAFNETYSKWMTQSEVEMLAQECAAAGSHGGFMDITDHPNLQPTGRTDSLSAVAAAYPAKPTHQTFVKSLFSKVDKQQMKAYNDKLTSFKTRYYTDATGEDAANWIKSEFDRIKGTRSDITVSLFKHTWRQPSVIATIKGKGPKADQIVIIGAHEDSISNGASAPGADDDASGTTTVLEVFRVLVASGFQPELTLEFHTYAAEEVGLRGSQAIASDYQQKKKAVYAMMQLDMTFYPSKTPVFGIITDYVSADLTQFLRTLVPAYSTLPISESKCGYGCSDHASWTKAGFPSCLPSEAAFKATNPYIHTVNDVISRLSIDHGEQFVRVALGYMVELSASA